MPDGNSKRIKPDRSSSGIKCDACTHPSQNIPFHRANTRLEIIPKTGFVCHPQLKGEECDRTFIRCHFNGEYQVNIRKKGDMKSVDYLAESDIRIRWKKYNLNTNVACECEIYTPSDPKPFKMRTVSCKDGKFHLASFKIHPRYIYHSDCTEVAKIEFEQQVKDVITILESTGWEFEKEIVRKGEPHHGINDTVLGSMVGDYNHSPTDPLHFDHSHGISESEVYGDNPDVIEIMVHLPTIMKTLMVSMKEMTTAMTEIQKQMVTLLDIQSNQFRILNNRIDQTVPPANDISGMYQ